MYLNREIARAVLIILAGVVSGGVSFFLGMAISGTGHGWTSAGTVAIVGALTAPAAAVAWLARNRWPGRVLAGAIVVLNVFMDAMTIAESLDAEHGMVHRVWGTMPGVVILAAVLAAVWQILPVAALIFSRRAASAPDSHS
jgi:hypothetical protein